jgi:NADH-quinone oxidoreductase E subunit
MPTTKDQKTEELIKYIDCFKDKENSESYLIAVLHKTQQLYGYVPRNAMDVISEQMEIPSAHIWGVATFYHYFKLNPPGKFQISVCLGTACYVKGSGDIMEALKDQLGIDVGETTEDGVFSLEGARCLGACGLAPVIMVNDKIHGDLTTDKVRKLIEGYRKKA